MKKIIFYLFFGTCGCTVFAQKRIIDSTTFKNWAHIRTFPAPAISNDGKFVLYAYTKTIDEREPFKEFLVVKSTQNPWEKEFTDVSHAPAVFTDDNKCVIFKKGKDTLCLQSLGSDKATTIPKILSYKIPNDFKECIAYLIDNDKKELILQDLRTGKTDSISGVKYYIFNNDGKKLLVLSSEKNNPSQQKLILITQPGYKQITIWQGNNASHFTFDLNADEICFLTQEKQASQLTNSLWFYKTGMEAALPVVGGKNSGIDTNLALSFDQPVFNKNGKQIFFNLEKKNIPSSALNAVKVDVWNYKDITPQSSQLNLANFEAEKYLAVINLPTLANISGSGKGSILQLGTDKLTFDNGLSSLQNYNQDYIIMTDWNDDLDKVNFWKSITIYHLLSTISGASKIIAKKIPFKAAVSYFTFSPNGKWLIYYDKYKQTYYSRNIRSGEVNDITHKIPVLLTDENLLQIPATPSRSNQEPVGIAGWLAGGKYLLIYDNYDIWKIDPSNVNAPVNLTNGFGRKNNIRLRLFDKFQNSRDYDKFVYGLKDTLYLTAYNRLNKYNGFFLTALDRKRDPILLTMGKHTYYRHSGQTSNFMAGAFTIKPVKAKNVNSWIVGRANPTDAPNYFLTSDFKNFTRISDLQPQKEFNWYTTELVQWKMLDGKMSQGILYKPENFDPGKKYPLIFDLYERKSDQLYNYEYPGAVDGPLNIPYFTSRGYLVFSPDIYYKTGEPGPSVLNSIIPAVKYMSKLCFVDATRIGVDGHSFGGYEVNYLVTHTHAFAAAAEAAGPTDFISGYAGIGIGGGSEQFFYEIGQNRIGATLWQRPDLYIKNSPVFNADKVTTPLLMMHNHGDEAVHFEQGLELYLGLWRLGKPAWMLQYDGEGHVLNDPKNQNDYTIRLIQFFDHYLKGVPAPKWMTEGIPARLKGIDDGLSLSKY